MKQEKVMIKRTQLKNMMKSIYENIYTNKQLNEISNMVFRSNLSEEVWELEARKGEECVSD